MKMNAKPFPYIRAEERSPYLMLDTAIAIVETTSPSSLLIFTSACSRALSATGSLRFEMLPVTKDR